MGKGTPKEETRICDNCTSTKTSISFKCTGGNNIRMLVQDGPKHDTYVLTDAADFEIYELPSVHGATRTSGMDQMESNRIMMEMGGRRRKSRKSKKSKRSKKSRRSRK